MDRRSWEATLDAFDKVSIGPLTLTGILAFNVYWHLVIAPVAYAAIGFCEGGWRGMSHQLFHDCRELIAQAFYIAPSLIPAAAAYQYPNGSPGRKVILAVPWLRHIPRELHSTISYTIALILGAYLDDSVIFIASTVLVIVFVLFSAWTYEIGWAEIDFIANIPVWKVLKATPTICFSYILGLLSLPVIFWYRPWLKKPNAAIRDEENVKGSIDEKVDLVKPAAKDSAVLAEQDKYLQEKILEGIESET